MICKKCLEELTADNVYLSDQRYCVTCGKEHATYLTARRQTLESLREMNLESKVIQTKYLIRQTIYEFGIDKVYISYSGGKDSTVLSHIAKSMYPDILHILKIVILIFCDFSLFSTYSRSYSVHFSFFSFFNDFVIFQVLKCVFLIFHDFQFSCHILGSTMHIFIFHVFQYFSSYFTT